MRIIQTVAICVATFILFGMAIDIRKMKESISLEAYKNGFKYGIEVGKQRQMAMRYKP